MIYLVFVLVIVWVVYNIAKLSEKTKKQEDILMKKIDQLEEKIK